MFYILHYILFYFIDFSNFITQFIIPKVLYSSKCALQHPRLVGKKCQLEGKSLASDVEVPALPCLPLATVSDQILLWLQELGDKMDSIDRRVYKTEAVLGQGSSRASSALNTSQNASNNAVSHGIATESHVTESVVPSMGFLRSNESLQSR